MASKWDDEFDLDEDPQPRAKPNQKKNRNSNHDDFLDLEDEAPKNVKLPVIGKQQPLRNQNNIKNSAEINLVQIPKRKVEPSHSPHDQEYQFQESLAPNPSIKQKSPKAEPKKVVSPPQKEEQEYQNEDFQEQKYQEDFEQHQEHKPSPPPQKPKQQSKEQAKPLSKPQNVPKPVPKDRKGAESVARKPQLNKPNSRNSARSQSGSRSANNSRSKPEQKKEELPNKYSSLAERTCPNYQRSTLEECNLDRLTRQNDKIRGLIKKFNDELNDLINKNIMQLKTKKEQKVVVPEQIIRVLEEQRNSNETALQNTIKDLQRLKGKQGELKEEEYQLGLQQKITQIKTSMGQINRVITKLKLEVNNEGNKLSKIDKDKEATTNMQDANSIKSGLALMKKEQEKNDQILQKLYIKYEQLSRKITQAEGRHTSQLEEAKNKGLSVQLNPQLIKKAEDIKKRIEICRLHKTKTQNLIKTKCQMITHQCDQVKIQIKAVQNSIQVCVSNCEEIQNEGRKIVDKARKNGKISEDILTSLQNIISELEASTPSSNREKEDTSTFTHPKGAKKYQSQKNVEKITPPPQQPKQQTQDDINLKKPTLFKKKEKEEDKPEQRVWKDDKNTQVKKHEKTNSIPELSKFENKEEGERKDEEKKKPFVIKKNKQPKPESDTAIEPPKEETKVQRIQTKKQADKSEETPSIAPRMMKFRRNKQEEGTKTQQTPKQSIQKPIAVPKQPSKPETKPIEQQSEKPIFAPKRFNLKLKDRNPQEGGYVATVVDKKEEPKPVEQFKPKGLNIQKESLTFTVETKIDPSKAIDVKINTEQDDKPKFNLRLRDRQKVENKVDPPNEVVKEPEAKITITLDDKAKENNQYANPYANAEAPKREREGPLKKQKPAQNIQKQNFNIYEQVEDITNVKEIKMNVEQPKPSVVNIKISAEQPNLHDLLGIKKNKQAVDQDLLVDASILAGKGKGKKESKKDTNFFGDLQL